MKLRLVIIFTLFVGISLFVFSTDSNALSPELRFEMLKVKLVEQLKAEEYSAVLTTMDEIKALGVPLPKSFTYFEGKALYESGNKSAAYTTLEKYVEGEGKGSKYFSKAIAYLVKAEGAYKAEKQEKAERQIAAEEARIVAEEEAQKVRQKEALLRAEAAEFAALPQMTKNFPAGLDWTTQVPKKYQRNPYLTVPFRGTRQQAKTYCDNLIIDNYDDWRIPTLQEFATTNNSGSRSKHVHRSLWVWGSSEFYHPGFIYQKNKLYDLDCGIYEITSGEGSMGDISEIRCVRTNSQKDFKDYHNHKSTLIEFRGNKIMMEDQYLKPDGYAYSRDHFLKLGEAINYCKRLTLDGYDDWRLPTKEDMLEKIPCNFSKKLYFSGGKSYDDDIWFTLPSFLGHKGGKINIDKCELSPRRSSTVISVRCVRDVE